MQLRHSLALPATLLLLAGLAGPWVFAADEPAPLLTLKGHRENVFAVSYSPDSKFLVTASGDPSIKVWDAVSGKNLKTYGETGKDAHNKIILALAVSPDGSQFATGSADNSMKLWDMPTSNFLKEIAQASAPRRVAVSPDGKLVAAGSTDGKVRLFDAATAGPAGEFAAGTAAVTALAFSSNGQLLAALSADGALRFFNVAGKAPIGEYAAHPGEGTGLGISPAGNAAFTTGADGSLKYWAFPPVASKTLMAEPVADLGMSTDGASFVLASGKSVRLGTLATGTLKSTFAADVDLTAAAASATYVAAATANRDVVLWQTKDAKAVKFAAHAGPVTGVTLNQAGNLLATSGKDGLVRLWTLPANAEKKIDGGGPVSAYVALADGKRFVVGGPDKTVRLMKLDGGAERMLTGHTAAVRGVAVLSDGKTVASAGEEGTIRVWGGKAETVALIGAHAGPVTTLVAVGGRLLSASPDGSVKLWQPVESAGKGTLAHAGAVTAVAISPDGTRLVTGCDDKQVRLWSMAGDKVERTFTGPTLAVLSVAVSRAGDRVAAGGADKSLFVWESPTAKEVRKLTGLSGAVKAVGLPADGKSVVAGLADGSVKLFDLATGKEGKPLTGHKGAVNALALPSKGDTVVTGGEDGAVMLQPLAGGAPVIWKAAGPVADVAVRPDAAMLAVGTGKAVQLFTPAGKLESTITTPANVRAVAYSFDGKRLAVAGDDNQARIYGSDGGLEETMAHDAAVNAAAFSTDGRRLVSASADKTARHRPLSLVWQARPGAAAQAIVSPKGDRVLAIGADGAVHSFNLADGKSLGKFEAHKKGRGVAISGDAARVVTIGDAEARVWDAGKLAKAIALKAEPSELALSSDGKRLAVALPGPKPGTNLVRIYDPATGAELLTLGEAEPISATVLAWQSDNRTLTIAGADRMVRLVDVNVVAAFEAHAGGVAGVTFNPAGQLVTAGADKAVRLWSAAGKMEKEFAKLAESPTAVTASFDGAMVAATAGKRVVAWTVADAKEAAAFDAPTPLGAVGFNSDRTRLAVATTGRAIVYDLTLKREAQAFLHGGNVTALAWSRGQPGQLFAAGADKKLELHTVGLTRQVVHDKPLRSLAVSGNGSYLVVGGDDGKARRYNAASGAAEKTYEAGDKAVTAVAVTKNEATVAVASADSKLRLIGSGDGKVVATLTQPSAANSLTFTPDNKGLICALSNGVIEGRDVEYTPGAALPEDFGRLLQSYAHGTEGGSVALPAAGNQFWSAGGDKAVKTWKLASESPGRSFPHPNSVNAVAFNNDGTRAITGCSDGKLRVFDVPKAAQLKQIDAHLTKDTTSIYGVAVTRDGKKAATAGQDGAVKVFEVESGKPLREIKAFKDKESPKGHTDSVLCVAFSPDGNQVVTAGMDQMIKVWNANDGSLLREFANPALKGLSHPGWVYAVRWTSDGKHVISVGQAPKLHGYVAVWEAATGKLVSGREMDVGTIFSVALSPDEKTMAIGTGGSVRSETHQAIVLRIPGR
jgi:WD40 repeat protein